MEHATKYGSVWTKTYKPIDIVEIIPNVDNLDEDKHTKRYMKKYGIENVRGGSYCQFELTQEQQNILKLEQSTSDGLCFTCGKSGHFANKCDNGKLTVESQLSPTLAVTYQLFQIEGKSLSEIMEIRKLAMTTIEGHIAECLKVGAHIDFNKLPLTKDKYQEILKVINRQGGDTCKLAPIKNACPPDTTYYQIKCAVAIYLANSEAKFDD